MLKGIKGAVVVLNALGPDKRDKILERISKQDPALAQELKESLITLEDIQFMSIKMLVDFTKDISLMDLGLSLRVASDELKEFILGNVSKTMCEEINLKLKGKPQSVNKVFEAQEKILKVLRKKIASGDVVLNKNSDDPFV